MWISRKDPKGTLVLSEYVDPFMWLVACHEHSTEGPDSCYRFPADTYAAAFELDPSDVFSRPLVDCLVSDVDFRLQYQHLDNSLWWWGEVANDSICEAPSFVFLALQDISPDRKFLADHHLRWKLQISDHEDLSRGANAYCESFIVL